MQVHVWRWISCLHTSSLQLDAWGGTEVPTSHGVVMLPWTHLLCPWTHTKLSVLVKSREMETFIWPQMNNQSFLLLLNLAPCCHLVLDESLNNHNFSMSLGLFLMWNHHFTILFLIWHRQSTYCHWHESPCLLSTVLTLLQNFFSSTTSSSKRRDETYR